MHFRNQIFTILEERHWPEQKKLEHSKVVEVFLQSAWPKTKTVSNIPVVAVRKKGGTHLWRIDVYKVDFIKWLSFKYGN